MKKKYANVGGQAVMEGIMMRSPKRSLLAVRKTDGSIVYEEMKAQSIRAKYKILDLPLIRGVVSFVESMLVGYKALSRSASLSGLEEESNGNKVTETLVLAIAFVLGVAISVGLFMVLPMFTVVFLSNFVKFGILKSLAEGLVRVLLFVLYIYIVAKQKDIKRIFQYHGAEHKTISCFEAKDELTIENVKKHSRLHPRCGTSFLFLVMIIGILFFSFVTWNNLAVRIVMKLLLLPVIAGVSFELIRFAGRHDNILTRIISAPGKALQNLTTAEPEDDQIELAICSLQKSLENEDGIVDEQLAYV